MYMTPYKKFYYYIIMVFEPFLFLVRKRNASPKKKYCSLRSPNGSKGRSHPAHFTMKHGFMMKKALLLSR